MQIIHCLPVGVTKPRILLTGLLIAAGLLMQGCAAILLTGAGVIGVTAVQERPVGQALDDKVIHTEISGKMLEKSEELFRNVSVTVVEGRVLMTGMVKEAAASAQAEKFAWSVKGVKEVLNEIEDAKSDSLATFSKDTWITTRLLAALVGDLDVRDLNYKVETSSSVVFLIGIAQSTAEMNRVIAHARDIDGVTKVVSHVILKTDPRRSN